MEEKSSVRADDRDSFRQFQSRGMRTISAFTPVLTDVQLELDVAGPERSMNHDFLQSP